jgi:RNA polymerase sigma-70 factor (ECF subfamily)
MDSFLPKKRFLSINTAILVKGCKQNDVLCQEQLYKLFYPELIKICFRYANDMDGAGIIYNNAMMKVFKGIDSYNEEGKLGGWIKTVVINCCIDFCKKKSIFKNTVNIILEDEVTILPDVFDRLSGKDIQQLIAQLPKATGTVFNLYIYEGFTHKQIGGQLGISEGTSKWHVSEAKKILKVKLENISETELKTNAAG